MTDTTGEQMGKHAAEPRWRVASKKWLPATGSLVARLRAAGTIAALIALTISPSLVVSALFELTHPPTVAAGELPDGSIVPASALIQPASVSGLGLQPDGTLTDGTLASGALPPGVVVTEAGTEAGGSPLVLEDTVAARTASDLGIPTPALAAYQRAETVINAADASCHLPWELLAAIGRVESDHGQFGGRTPATDGVVNPAIIGIPLDGRAGTTKIADTDGGVLDTDKAWDHAVGPMQFIPSTWASIGVDADGDNVRNPQDLDDAALAAAVYLCAGDADLSTVTGQRGAIYSYNHSNQYVALVLSIMADYGTTAVSVVPASFPTTTTTIPSTLPTPVIPEPSPDTQGTAAPNPDAASPSTTPTPNPTKGPSGSPTGGPSTGPTANPSTGGPSSSPSPSPSSDASPSASSSSPSSSSSSSMLTPSPSSASSAEPSADPASDPSPVDPAGPAA
jgi:hypothetical protein